jgi:hypothetical protein
LASADDAEPARTAAITAMQVLMLIPLFSHYASKKRPSVLKAGEHEDVTGSSVREDVPPFFCARLLGDF